MHFIFSVPSDPHAGLGAVARLRLGISLEEAPQNIGSIGRALAHDFPAANRDRIPTLNLLRDRAMRPVGKGLFLLLACSSPVYADRMPGCFLQPANAGTFGNAGIDILEGPPMKNIDLALIKNFHMFERFLWQFEVQAQDVLNHPNFGNPS
ncbi:MAG TPA: hypothetical protein VKV15_11320, partial [Bryobacteraceae bacterium]|nr:hypothetical protein [Bryobacteraceae bacterium]